MVQSSSTSPPPTGEVSQASDSRYVSRTHRTRLTRARSQLLVIQDVVVAAGRVSPSSDRCIPADVQGVVVEGDRTRVQSSCVTPASCGGRGESLSARTRCVSPSSCFTRALRTRRGESLSAQRTRCMVWWGSAPVPVFLMSARQLLSCHHNHQTQASYISLISTG